jgi:hypothetical protein
MSHEFVSITKNIADTHTNTCDMYKSRQRHIHDPVISSQDESYTWYIFYNRDEKCLQRGTDWVFKYSSLRFVCKGLMLQHVEHTVRYIPLL